MTSGSDAPAIVTASDHSLLVTFGDHIDAAINNRVRTLFLELARERIDGIRNLHPAYASLLIDFDPLAVSSEDVRGRVGEALSRPSASISNEPRRIEIPVRYGGESGPDLEAVADHCSLTPAAVVERHAAVEYLVHFLGFAPGFPYLGGMDPALSVPRLDTPRKRVPAGSVAIGGSQTGIYPSDSPGGWRIIGHTDLRLFDAAAAPPSLLLIGDLVRFRPLPGATFA